VAQSFTQVQQALDARLLTVPGITASGMGANFTAENSPNWRTTAPDPTGKLWVRSTLRPYSTTNETLGQSGYVKVNGLYAVDVMSRIDSGYTAAKLMADAILAAFVRGTRLTLANGDALTIESASLAPDITQGAWRASGLYCVQVQVRWFGYVVP
jgi:hypothetical protein